jgi:hypothetical protein
MTVPASIRRILELSEPAVTGVWVGAMCLAVYAQRQPAGGQLSSFVTRIAFDAMLTFMYARTALFLGYGEFQPLAP